MDLDVARAVLSEAVSGGYLEALPETEEEILETAEHFAEFAQKEYNAGWGKNNETIQAIVNLSGTLEETDKSEPTKTAQEDNEVGPVSSAFFKDFPIPAIADGAAGIDMPWNVSDLEDYDLRKYLGIMNHYYRAARYARAEQESELKNVVHLRDDALRRAIKNISQDNILKETKKPGTVVTAEASLNEDFIRYDEEARKLEETVDKLKALTDIYDKDVQVLSREASIRHNEFERDR